MRDRLKERIDSGMTLGRPKTARPPNPASVVMVFCGDCRNYIKSKFCKTRGWSRDKCIQRVANYRGLEGKPVRPAMQNRNNDCQLYDKEAKGE